MICFRLTAIVKTHPTLFLLIKRLPVIAAQLREDSISNERAIGFETKDLETSHYGLKTLAK